MPKRYLALLSVAAFLAAGSLHAQSSFTVLWLSRKAAVDKATLNEKLKTARSRAEVTRLLTDNLKDSRDVTARILEKNGQGHQWWVFNNGGPAPQGGKLATLSTRGSSDEAVYRRYQFREVFRDTLAVIDTLKIVVDLRDASYPVGKYHLVLANAAQSPVPVANENELYIIPAVSGGAAGSYQKVTLRNAADPTRNLGGGWLLFLDEAAKDELKTLLQTLRRDQVTDPSDLTDYAQDYLRQTYGGRVLRTNLYRWVEQAVR